MEHRWGERFAVDLAVRVAGRPYTVRVGRLIDLSVSGAYIKMPADPRLLSRVQIAIALPERLAHPTSMVAAYVARKSEDGVGVEWCEHAPKPVLELLRYIAAHRPGRQRIIEPAAAPARHARASDLCASDAHDEPQTIAEA